MTPRKTTPHLKRGRKPKPKPPKCEAGAPRKRLRAHPDRYAVARFDVAQMWLRTARTGKPISAAMVRSIDANDDLAELGRAAGRLRKKADWYTARSDMAWRRAIANAVTFIIETAADPPTIPTEHAIISDLIETTAASVGEADWARRELLPLIWLKPTAGCATDLRSHIALLIATIGWATDIRAWIAAQTGDVQPEIADISA